MTGSCRVPLVVLGAVVLSCAAGALASADQDRATVLRTPDGGIQPQAAMDARGVLHLIYFKGDPKAGDLFYVRRESGSEQFSEPIRVNSRPGSAIAVGTIRGGQLAVAPDGRVHVTWNGSSEALPRGPLNPELPAGSPYNGAPTLYTRLNDDGTAFEPQRNLMQFTFGLDGGGSVAADGAGNVYVVWHAAAPTSSLGNKDDQPAEEQGEAARRVWVARSTDAGKTFVAEIPAFLRPTGACGCCGLRAFADSRRNLHVLYRAATANVDRDMYLLSSPAGGLRFRGTLLQSWKVGECPMSSASLAESPAGPSGAPSVLAAWETAGQVYYARVQASADASSSGEGRATERGGNATPIKVSRPIRPPGTRRDRKHPALAANAAGEKILVWTEGTGWQKGGSLAWQVFDHNDRPAGDAGRADGIPVWSLATVVAGPDGRFTIIY